MPFAAIQLIAFIFNLKKKADVALYDHKDNKDTKEDINLGLSSDKRSYIAVLD